MGHDEPLDSGALRARSLRARPRLPPPPPSGRWRGFSSSLLARILTVAAGILVLIGAVAISFVVFVIALTVLLVFGLYPWW